MKDLIKKIQDLPEFKRKIILWIVIVILGLVLVSFYIKNVQKRLKGFEVEKFKEELQLPSIKEGVKELPKLEIPKIEMPKVEVPEIDEEKLKEELEKMMNEAK